MARPARIFRFITHRHALTVRLPGRYGSGDGLDATAEVNDPDGSAASQAGDDAWIDASLQHQVPYGLWALVLIAGCIPFGYALYYKTLRPDWWKRLGILWGVILVLQVLTMPLLIRFLMAGD